MGCDRLYLFLILPPTCCLSCDSLICNFFMRAGALSFQRFLKGLLVMHLWSAVSIFHQKFSSERLVNLPTHLHDISEKTYASNNDYIPVMKLLGWVKAEGLLFRGNGRQSKKCSTLLSLLLGPGLFSPGWYDLSQESVPFPMCPYQTTFYFPIMIQMTVTRIII